MNLFAITFLVVITPILAICLAWLGVLTIPTNPLGWFLLLVGIAYAFGAVIFIVFRRQRFWEARASKDILQEERGDRSFWLITLGMMAVFYLSPLEFLHFAAWLPHTISVEFGGFGLVTAGSVLFVWARRTLGVNYSGHVMVGKRQELVQSGPYRFIRHPAYAGYLLMALGISLGYSSLVGLASVFALLLPSLVYRIKVEEKLLGECFGEAYHQYARKVKRLIPNLW
jgi:protein-S-isoprenylcysteine O-methyltransferase Ste14